MPGQGLLSFANAHWPFSSPDACSFDAARLEAWRSAGLLREGRAKAKPGQGALAAAELPRRGARPGAAREPSGQQRLPGRWRAWEAPPGARVHLGKRIISLSLQILKTGILFDPAKLLLGTHSVYQDIKLFSF